MTMKQAIDLRRRRAAEEAAAELEALNWLERLLRDLGLSQVLFDNATDCSAAKAYEWEEQECSDWTGRVMHSERYVQVFHASVYIPKELKELVARSLLKAATTHNLNWEKRVQLTHTKPYDGKVPFAHEYWSVSFPHPDTWRESQLVVIFYWVPEIGEQLTPTCTVQEVEHTTKPSTKKEVVSVCALENNDG